MAKKTNKVNKVLALFLSRLKRSGIDVSRLILFGSYAQGNAKPYSDIDVAVVSSSFNGKGILKRQELLGEIIFPLGEPIEALGYTPQEIKSPSPFSFISEILETGKEFYKKS